MKRIAAQYPGGRLGEPDDLAGLAHFLMNSASEHISGSVIFVRPPSG
jgi:NAD(P)-dependent dehydrogenase (short-subunit alcohol dehydrogenase family)